MKIQIICFFVSILSTGVLSSQNTYGHKDFEVYKEYSKNPSNIEGLDIYELNEKNLEYLLSNSKKEFKIIYTFGFWCRPCVEYLPSLLDFVNRRNDIELIILLSERDDSKNLLGNLNYFKKIKYNKPIFNISDSYSPRPRRKYDNFIQSIIPGHSEYGYSLDILYNKKNEPIYSSTYNESAAERIEKITQLTKK